MSSLAQHKHLPSLHHQVCKRQLLLHPVRVYCSSSNSTTTTAAATTNPKPNGNQLVIEPRPAPSRPTVVTAATRPMDNNDPSLQSTWSHRAWVTAGCTTLLISLGESIKGSIGLHMWAEPILAGCAGYILADLGSGVYHWAIDNYGDGTTPLFGAQIEAFQGHHKFPWTITRRQFANNLHALARVVTFTVLPIAILCHDPVVQGFVALFAGCIMFSQQFHAWAHGTKSRLPPLVVALQEAGVLVSRSQHAAHHRPPYDNNYCIVSGVWNEFLDKNRVLEALEMMLYFQLGLRPRSWSEPASEWMEEVEITTQIEAQ
ncbi:fatty acid desaturase 4, chloroplastic-like [Lotus japonicus]|uniref:fatty acid desaturase 4, chloroplastic-like n=1 Tax=Lotus japonicus TaxID=34305 RepID=UPI00258C4E32|nr:fatty acid desaturase 4, chloroplastic-like [Lotus japonicus]